MHKVRLSQSFFHVHAQRPQTPFCVIQHPLDLFEQRRDIRLDLRRTSSVKANRIERISHSTRNERKAVFWGSTLTLTTTRMRFEMKETKVEARKPLTLMGLSVANADVFGGDTSIPSQPVKPTWRRSTQTLYNNTKGQKQKKSNLNHAIGSPSLLFLGKAFHFRELTSIIRDLRIPLCVSPSG